MVLVSKKPRHSASWRCGFSHQMKCQQQRFFFSGFAFPVCHRKIPPNLVAARLHPGSLLLHQRWKNPGLLLGHWSFARFCGVDGIRYPLQQISGCWRLGSLMNPTFGWVFLSGEIEGFSVVSGESCGFFDEQNASKWFVSFLPLAWIIEIRNRSRVKRSLKIPQHLPLTFRPFEPLRLDCSPFSFRVCECQVFCLRKRHQTPEVTSCCSRFQAGGDIGHFWDLSFSSNKTEM